MKTKNSQNFKSINSRLYFNSRFYFLFSRFLLVFLLSIVYFLFSAFSAASQVKPEFFITWKAESFVPSAYQGKILPTNNTAIEVNLELIDNGKFANLSKNEIRWFANNKLIQTGNGLKNINWQAPKFRRDAQDIKISIINYKNFGNLEKTFIIPIVTPEVIIDAPYPENRIPTGTNDFRALPYFFNIRNIWELALDWSANGQKAESMAESNIMNLNTPKEGSGNQVNLKIGAVNLFNELESANDSINLFIK